MTRKLFLIITLSIFFLKGYIADAKTSTLLTTIKKQEQADSILNGIQNGLYQEKKLALNLNLLAIWFSKNPKGGFEKGIEYANKALEVATEISDYRNMGIAYHTIEGILEKMGLFEESMRFALKSLEIFESLGDTLHTYKAYSSLGVINLRLKNIEKGRMFMEKALALTQSMDNKAVRLAGILNFGAVLEEAGQANEALKYYEHVENEIEEIRGHPQFEIALCVLYTNKAVALDELKRYSEARLFCSKALNLSKENTYNRCNLFVNLAELTFKMGRPDSCTYWAQKGLDLANENEYTLLMKNAYQWMAKGMAAQGDYRGAWNNMNNEMKLKDSLFNQERLYSIQNLLESYNVGKKESEIKILKAESETKSIYIRLIFVVLIFSIISLSLLAFAYFQKRKHSIRLKQKSEKILQLNRILEIKALRSQLDPHFVFNALIGVQQFINSGAKFEALEHLSQVSRLIRTVLQNSSKDIVPLHEELNLAQRILQVEQCRFPNRFTFEVDMDDELKDTPVPFMILQPFVENAVVHGILPLKREGHIIVRAHGAEGKLIMEVHDNGVGCKAASSNTHPGFDSKGTSLTKERLDKLSQLIDAKIELFIYDKEDEMGNPAGTLVMIVMPINKFAVLEHIRDGQPVLV